jgi:hypothetical protein
MNPEHAPPRGWLNINQVERIVDTWKDCFWWTAGWQMILAVLAETGTHPLERVWATGGEA